MFQVQGFNFWIQRENGWCFARSLYVRRIFCRLLCTCKSNTAGLSQEIITAISSLACSLAAAPIGWNYFRKELTAAPRGALKLSKRLAGTRGPQPVSLCKHSPSPRVPSLFDTCHLSALIQIQWHAASWGCSCVCIHTQTACNYLTSSCYIWGWRRKQNRRTKETKRPASPQASVQSSCRALLRFEGQPLKPQSECGQRAGGAIRHRGTEGDEGWAPPLCGSRDLTGYERQMGFVLKRKAIDEGKNRSLWLLEDKV